MPMLLCADWKIVTRTGDRTLTEYFKGSLTRTDPSPSYATVMDFDRRRQVNWRSDLRQYQIVEWPPDVRPNSSSPVINIEKHSRHRRAEEVLRPYSTPPDKPRNTQR